MPGTREGNRSRIEAAGYRDRELAGRIMASPAWSWMSERQRRVVFERSRHPGMSWTELAEHMGQPRSSIWTVWRRLMAEPGVRGLA